MAKEETDVAREKKWAREKSWRPATQMVRGGMERTHFDEISEGMFLTSSYAYDTAGQARRAFKGEEDHYMYSRYGNPTVTMFESRMALLEGAEFCQATASGMGAVFAALACQLEAGDRLVASKALFGSCDYVCSVLLPQYGVETTMVNGTDLGAWEAALAQPTAMVFLETPSNPAMDIIDLPAVTELAHAAGARVVVDNVFATPIFQKPLAFGGDIVIYSTTKHIDGQGRVMGGAILTDDEDFIKDHLRMFIRHTGPTMSPFNAWVLIKGLETLELRVRHQTASAQTLAEFLSAEKSVTRVVYPGLASHPQFDLAKAQMSGAGTVVAFEVAGGGEGAFAVLNALQIIDISNNLGDAKSMVTHPATTTHQRLDPEARAELGITDGMIRLSVGLEDVEDLREDLAQALAT